VAGTAKTLTGSKLFETGKRPAGEVLITVETAPIRYTLDGTTPVGGSAGQYADTGTTIKITGIGNLQQFQMIRDGGSSAVVDVTYFR
jgi:hypothetical protein